MSRVELNVKAPEISLMTHHGYPFSLSEHLGQNLLLVLHRGFT
jgi:peroxiredoxin